MTPPIPVGEPAVVVPGDTWQWTAVFADYPPSDGWTLAYSLRGAGSLDITATAQDDETYLVTALPFQTSALVAGPYQYAAIVSRVSGGVAERVTVRTGVVQVAIDLSTAAAGVAISPAEQMLTQIRAVLQGRATDDVQSYQIAGRALTKIPMKELLGLETIYAARVWRERHPTATAPLRQARFSAAR